MKTTIGTAIAATLMLVLGHMAFAGDVVGYNKITVPATSDVLITAPFNNEVAGEYTVASTASATITVNESLDADTYDGTYYVRVVGGNGEGLWSTVSSNGSGTITVADQTVVDELADGDEIRVYAHHTIGSLFPDRLEDVAFNTSTQIQVYNATGSGQFKSATGTAQYAAVPPLFNYAWTGSANAGTVLAPQSMFLVRNGSGDELAIVLHGAVPDHKSAVVVPSGARDLNVGTGYPLAMTIDEMGIGADGRQVQVYNNAASGQFKSAVGTATYAQVPPLFNYEWSGSADGDTVITGSEAIIVRLPSGDAGGVIVFDKPY